MQPSAGLKKLIFFCSFICLLLICEDSFAQKANKPRFKASRRENLSESDNNFGLSHKKFKLKRLFKKKKEKQRKTTKYKSHRKAGRDGFYKKRYTGKKGIFGKRKSGSWGGKSFKKNGKEDKRLFKAGKSNGNYKNRKKKKK